MHLIIINARAVESDYFFLDRASSLERLRPVRKTTSGDWDAKRVDGVAPDAPQVAWCPLISV